jgi:hypothetical protein
MELFYGDPGSGKTRAIIELIRKMYKDTGKKARIYIGDGSAVMYEQIIDEGCIAGIMDFTIRDYPFTTCQQITEGLWPIDPKDPKSKMRLLTPQEINETGMWVFEGISTAGQYMMGDKPGGLAQRAADGESMGGDYVIMFSDSKEHNFGGNSIVHYNLGQRHLMQDILRSKNFPGTVIWTAHERYDDGTKSEGMAKGQAGNKFALQEKKVGPEFIGKALTQIASRDFGNTLHFVTVTKKVQTGQTDTVSGRSHYVNKSEYRVYTRDHFDPEGIAALKYIAVNRDVSDDPDHMPEYVVADKPGQAVLKFYEIIEQGKADKKAKKP